MTFLPVYQAEQSCKAAQYARDAGEKTMLVSRVIVGVPAYLDSSKNSMRRCE